VVDMPTKLLEEHSGVRAEPALRQGSDNLAPDGRLRLVKLRRRWRALTRDQWCDR